MENTLIAMFIYFLKGVLTSGIESEAIAKPTEVLVDKAIERFFEILSTTSRHIKRTLDDDALCCLGIQQNRTQHIRYIVLEFLKQVDINDLAITSSYNVDKMTEAFWQQFHRSTLYAEEDSDVKVVLRNISQEIINTIKQKKTFIADTLIDIINKFDETFKVIIRNEKKLDEVLFHQKNIEAYLDKISDYYGLNFFRECMDITKEQFPTLTREIIAEHQEMLKNDVILPWMKHSPSYQAVFPSVFIKPVIYGNKIEEKLTYEDLLLKYRDKNIVLIGDAGSGKSTLMRYIYLSDNANNDFLYLRAGALLENNMNISLYDCAVVSLLYGKLMPEGPKVVLLDEMDEAFTNSDKELVKVVSKLLNKPKHISIWFGWRSEHFYQKVTSDLQSFLYNILEIHNWDEDRGLQKCVNNPEESMIFSYISQYETVIKERTIYRRFMTLVKQDEKVFKFVKNPLNLVLLLYLLTQDNYKTIENTEIKKEYINLYSLYKKFFQCWVQREKRRGTSSLSIGEIKTELQRIAEILYYRNECFLQTEDTAITDLLTFSYNIGKGEEKIALGFCHRSFCAFFYADKIFESLRLGGTCLIEDLSQPLRNDVTDFVREAAETVRYVEDVSIFQNNMKAIYFQIEEMDYSTLEKESCEKLHSLSNQQLLYLKNELIYFITRLPGGEDAAEFIEVAYRNTKNPYLKLDLAYGAALTGPSWVRLDYAKSLVPGSEADWINRSWSLAFLGDVQANPYFYHDTKEVPWTKSRDTRLLRFQSNKEKAARFRILDLPLIYCFYASRCWKDVSYKDFNIIKSVSVDLEIYTEDEKCFLREQKERLIREYEKHLVQL